jgi:hypothetical protein
MDITANLAGDRIRATLKQNFGDIKFHVRRYDRARVHRYVISWTDGPSENAVQSLALPCIHDVPFGSIYCSRWDASDVV